MSGRPTRRPWGHRLPASASLWRDDRLEWLGRNLGFEPERLASEVHRTDVQHQIVLS